MFTKKDRFILILIIAVGVVLRIALVYFSTDIGFGTDAPTYDRIAQNIAFKGAYSVDSLENKNPELTAVYPPVYPVFLAGIYRLFGHNLKLVSYIHIILYILACLPIFRLANILFNKKTALWAIGFFSIEPISVFYSVVPMPEIITVIFLSLSIYFLANFLKNYRDNPKVYVYFIFSCIMLALAMLSKIIFLFFPVIFLIVLIAYMGKDLRKLFMSFLTMVIIISLILSLWIIRNYRVYNKLGFDGNINFITNYGDYANTHPHLIFNKKGCSPRVIRNQATRYIFGTNSILIYHAIFNDAKLFEKYNKIKMKLAQKILKKPQNRRSPLCTIWANDLKLYLKLFKYSLKFTLLETILLSVLLFIYGFCIIGMYFAFKDKKRKELFLLCLVILYFAAIIPIAVCGSRYRFPSIPFYCILAGYGFEKIILLWKKRKAQSFYL